MYSEDHILKNKSFIEGLFSPPRFVGFDSLKEYGIKEIDVLTKDDEFYFNLDEVENMGALNDGIIFIMKDEFSEEAKIFEFFNVNIVALKYIIK